MTDDLWDYADLKALDIVCREYFGHSRFVALQKTLEYCAFNGWECEDESRRAQLASAIRYGAEMAEREMATRSAFEQEERLRELAEDERKREESRRRIREMYEDIERGRL